VVAFEIAILADYPATVVESVRISACNEVPGRGFALASPGQRCLVVHAFWQRENQVREFRRMQYKVTKSPSPAAQLSMLKWPHNISFNTDAMPAPVISNVMFTGGAGE